MMSSMIVAPVPRVVSRSRIAPTWTILIPTLGERAALFARLMGVLLPQVDRYGGRVRVLGWWSHGTPTIGHIRDRLLAHATSDYTSFVDDDDLVPDYYVDQVVLALAQDPDHVGFKVQYLENGAHRQIIDHSLRYGRWGRGRRGLFRDVTHIDPVRRELARRASFDVVAAGQAEDTAWVRAVRPHLRTETYVDMVMYHYLWSQAVSAWQRPDLIRATGTRPEVPSPHFAWHPECGR